MPASGKWGLTWCLKGYDVARNKLKPLLCLLLFVCKQQFNAVAILRQKMYLPPRIFTENKNVTRQYHTLERQAGVDGGKTVNNNNTVKLLFATCCHASL
jgi:hypothetical protein